MKEDDISRVMRVLQENYQQDISQYNRSFLEKTFQKELHDHCLSSIDEYCSLLTQDLEAVASLLASLSISYSEFFRNPLTFVLLEQVILPRLIREVHDGGGSEMRVWSAGCAGGQESYSLAILLEEIIRSEPYPFSYRIFATDISLNDLALANAGLYDEHAVQNVRFGHMQRYFTRVGEKYQVGEPLKSHLDFSYYDLLCSETCCPSTSIFGDFHLVICSNLLFYYQPSVQNFIIDKIGRCISPNGCLVTSETERAVFETRGDFKPYFWPVPIFFKTPCCLASDPLLHTESKPGG